MSNKVFKTLHDGKKKKSFFQNRAPFRKKVFRFVMNKLFSNTNMSEGK